MKHPITGEDLPIGCGCHRCVDSLDRATRGPAWMILCPTCGNKRCPRASDHALTCTSSNEPGQQGSVYA